jgi:hypothetical protein
MLKLPFVQCRIFLPVQDSVEPKAKWFERDSKSGQSNRQRGSAKIHDAMVNPRRQADLLELRP